MINNKVKEWLLVSVVLAIILSCFTTFLPKLLNYLMISYSLLVSFAVSRKRCVQKGFMMIVLFMLISFWYHELGVGHFDNYGEILYTYAITLVTLILSTEIKLLSKQKINLLFIIFIFCFLVSLIYTILLGLIDPLVVRTAFGENSDEFKRGMFSYSVMHVLPCIAVFFAYCCLCVKRYVCKAVFLFFVFLVIFALARLIITTSLLASIISVLLLVCFYYGKGKFLRFLPTFIILGIIFVITLPVFFDLWQESTDNIELVVKFESMMDSASSGEAEGEIEGRKSRYLKSIVNTENILFGLTSKDNSGNHSFVLDMWAFYGVFSLLFFIGWYKMIFFTKYRIYRRLDRGAYVISLLPIIMLVCLKSMVFWVSYFVLSLVVLPLCFYWFELNVESKK